MEAEIFSKYHDPFFEILMLKVDPAQKASLQNSNFKLLIDSIPNLHFNQDEVAKMNRKIMEGGKYSDVLSSYNIDIQYKPSLIPSLPEFDKLTNAEIDVFCKFILITYNGWVLQQDKKTTMIHFSTICENLIKIVNTNYKKLVESAIIRCFAYCAYINEANYQVILYTTMAKYLETAKTVENSIYNVILTIYNNILFNRDWEILNSDKEFLKVIVKMLEKHGNVKDIEYIQSIVLLTKTYLMNLEPVAIDLLNKALKYLIFDEKQKIVTKFTSYLTLFIKENGMHICFACNPNTEPIFVDVTKYSKLLNQDFPMIETFGGDLRNTPQINLPESYEIENYITEKVFEKLQIVIDLLVNNVDIIDTFFSVLIAESYTNHDVYAVLLYMSIECLKTVNFNTRFDTFFMESGLIDPTIICSEYFSYIEVINNFRQAALTVVIMSGQTTYSHILKYCAERPLLFTEFLLRCASMTELVSSRIFKVSTKMMHEFLTYFVIYQNINYSGFRIVEGCRYAMFLFLSLLLTKGNLQEEFFADLKFCETIFSFLFEESVRPFIIGILRSFLNLESTVVAQVIGISLSNVTEHTRMSFPDEKSVLLDNDIIQTVVDALSHRISLGEVFIVMCKSLALSITLVDNSKNSQIFLLGALQLFAYCSHVFEFNEDERLSLTCSIKIAFGEEPPIEIFNGLLQIISGNNSNFKNHSFLIRRPKILQVLYKVFEHSKTIYKVLEFIDKLCQYNQNNIYACREGGIDSLIINTLLQVWYSKQPPEEEFIDLCLSLLHKICSLISTITIVQRILALLCPFENEHLPLYFNRILNGVNKIAASAVNQPKSFVVMNKDFILKPEQKLVIDKKFWFICWIKLQEVSHKYNPNLFTATNSKGEKIVQFSLRGNQISIYMRSKTMTNHSTIDRDIKVQEWTFFAIECLINADGCIFTPYIGSSVTPAFNFPLMMLNEKDNSLSLTFGGLEEDINVEDFSYALLGGLALFNDCEIENIYRFDQHGPQFMSRAQIDYKYKFVPEKTSQNLNLNLGTILAGSNKISMLLPLFSVVLLKNKDGSRCYNYLDPIIQLLSNILLISEETELFFYETNGFKVISNVMASYPQDLITYQTYNHFFSLLQLLRTKRLQRQLIYEILMNLNIWIIADRDSFLRIIRHWARVLLPSIKDLPGNPILFRNLLNEYVFYFWDDNKTDTFSLATKYSRRKRAYKIDLLECRRAFCSCILQRIDESFTRKDFEVLISHILRCTDVAHAEWLINLIKQMAIGQDPAISYIKEEMDDLKFEIFKLIDLRSDAITVCLIEIIIQLHQLKLIKYATLSEDIDLLISICDSRIINKTIFNLLIAELYDSTYLILPLLFWFALNIGPDFVLKLSLELTADPKYCRDKNWCFWPLVAAIKYKDVAPQVIMFICRCDPKEWINIYNTAFVICKQTNSDFFEFRLCMLQSITGFYASEYEFLPREVDDIYFRFIWMAIFNIPSNYKNALHSAMQESPFDIEYKEKEFEDNDVAKYIRGENNNFISSEQILGLCSQFDDNVEFQFGAFIDKKGNWVDLPVSNNILTSFSMTNNTKYLNIYFFVLARLLHGNDKYGQEQLKSLKIDKLLLQNNQLYIDYLIVFMKGHYMSCSIEKYKTSDSLQHYFDALRLNSNLLLNESKSQLSKSFNQIKKRYEKILSLTKETEITQNFAISSLNEYLEIIQSQQEMNKRLWESIWAFMTAETAPWEKAIKFSDNVMRSNSLSDSFAMILTTKAKAKPIRKRSASISLLSFTTPQNTIIETGEKPLFVTEVTLHSIKYTFQGNFSLYNEKICITGGDSIRHEIKLTSIRYLLPRQINHHPIAIEVFTKEGESILISFEQVKTNEVVNRINMLHYISSIGAPQNFAKEWSLRKLSNFEYILLLNILSGRSYSTLSMYPIFPWVLKDYDSEVLDLNNSDVYRDLSKPIAKLKSNFFERSFLIPKDIIYYLQAVEPFMTLRLEMRTIPKLNSIKEAFEESTEIMREAIPEFYCFDMAFDNVVLPKWAKDSIDFVNKMRAALESEYVSEHLNEWIDLVFGKRQVDEDSDYKNVFHENLYPDIWDLNFTPEQRLVIEQDKETKGQIPIKLFRHFHIKREKEEIPPNRKNLYYQPDINSVKSCLITEINETVTVSIVDKNNKRVNTELVTDPISFIVKNTDVLSYEKLNDCVIIKDNSVISFGENISHINKSELRILQNSQVLIHCSSNRHFMAITVDMTALVYSKEGILMLKNIPFYGVEPLCCSISDEFHIFAIANSQGDIFLQSFAYSSHEVRVIKLGFCTPISLCISPNFGNVVVFSTEIVGPRVQNFITVVTINGKIINKKVIKMEVTSMSCAKCRDDIVIIGGSTGRVQVAKTTDLEFTEVYHSKHSIVSAEYSQAIKAIIIVTSRGEIVTIPYFCPN